jgi:hypothetical protein
MWLRKSSIFYYSLFLSFRKAQARSTINKKICVAIYGRHKWRNLWLKTAVSAICGPAIEGRIDHPYNS